MATEKVIINGQEVIGDVEFIRSLLGFGNVSARTEAVRAVKTENTNKVKESKPKKSKNTNKVDEFFDKANLVQVQEKVVEFNSSIVPDGYIETKYKVEEDKERGFYRISHSICGSNTYIDKVTGEEKIRRFNKYPKSLANQEIDKLVINEEFKGQLYKYRLPLELGGYWCRGFKSEELANKALEMLPRFVIKDESLITKEKPAVLM